jgi:predicted acyltransferase (DUF342 family)
MQAVFIFGTLRLGLAYANVSGATMPSTRSIATLSPAIVLLIACSFTGAVHAESLRCDNNLVTTGQTRREVRAKCGEPSDIIHSTLVRSSEIGRRVGYRGAFESVEETLIIPVEVWNYNLGPHRLMCRLRFVNGVLEQVETLEYGFNDGDR